MRQLCFFLLTILFSFGLSQSVSATRIEKKSNISVSSANKAFVIPRADPAYIQQLEKRALLSSSANIAKIVSGSELAWQSAASRSSPDELLSLTSTWLALHPMTLLADSNRPAFAHLNSASFMAILRDAHIKGLFLAPLGSAGDQWFSGYQGIRTGEDMVQFDFSEAAGSVEQYKRLMNSLLQNNYLLGSSLIPGATGLGPDFFLAARACRDYPGLYCMVELPTDAWSLLPETKDEFDLAVLPQETVLALNEKGLIPKTMRHDINQGTQHSGWAATGKVRGLDGNTRRWVYRYYLSPQQPILNWEDPSQAALRIVSAGAVNQVGLLGQTLIGMNFKALHGLDPVLSEKTGDSASFSLEPALTAAQTTSRQIRRYGGWSWLQDDNTSLYGINDFLNADVDYIQDSALSPAVEHAMMTQNADLLKYMLDELLRLGVDSRRLVHTQAAQGGINYSLPHLAYLAQFYAMPEAENFRQAIIQEAEQLAQKHQSVFSGNFLHTTAMGCAAIAAQLPAFSVTNKQDLNTVRKIHTTLLHYKAMQPGLLVINGQDLVGALPLDPTKLIGSTYEHTPATLSWGGYPLQSSAEGALATRFGVPKSTTLLESADIQVHNKNSFLQIIRLINEKRDAIQIAKGKLLARLPTQANCVVATATKLPSSQLSVTVVNFGLTPKAEQISFQYLDEIYHLSAPTQYLGSANFSYANKKLFIEVPAQRACTLLFSCSSKPADNEFPLLSTNPTPIISSLAEQNIIPAIGETADTPTHQDVVDFATDEVKQETLVLSVASSNLEETPAEDPESPKSDSAKAPRQRWRHATSKLEKQAQNTPSSSPAMKIESTTAEKWKQKTIRKKASSSGAETSPSGALQNKWLHATSKSD